MTDTQFQALCNTYGFASSRALRELIDCAVGQAALAEPTVKESLQVELAPEPGDFDHNVGADRFKVVRGAFWWHVLIGDSPTEHGKFRSRVSAEKMAADLLREFRNGAFVQHEAALAEPVQEPVAWLYRGNLHATDPSGWCIGCPTRLYAAPPQRKPLTEEEITQCFKDAGIAIKGQHWTNAVRNVERAHGITS